MKWHIRLTRDIAAMIPQAHPNIPPTKYIMYGAPIGLAEYLNTPVFVDLKKLIAPTGIFVGKIGTGKSTSAKALLYRQHYIFQTSMIIFDAHGEYAAEIRAMGGTVIDMVNQTINPCKRDHTITTSKKALQLTDMLNTIFEFTDVQRAVLIKYIKNGYEIHGDDLSFKMLTDMITYDFERGSSESKTLGALSTRFDVLADEIFGDQNSISLDEITKGLFCIDVSKIDNNHLRNIVMLSILQYLYNSMLSRQGTEPYQDNGDIRLLIMIDESGRIASSEHSVATKLVKEARKFKIGLFFGIQDIPDIDSKILSNYGFVFVHKLDNQDYITKLQNDCSFSPEQAFRIRMLPVGTAFVKLNFRDASFHSPFIVRVLKEEIPVNYEKQSPKPTPTCSIREIRVDHKVDNTTFHPQKKNHNLDDIELKLIRSIDADETLVVTEHYDNLGVNEYQGNKARQSLERQGYIEGSNLRGGVRRGKVLRLTDLARKELGLAEKTNRFGGHDTKNEIETIKTKLESLGNAVMKEYTLSDGRRTDIVVNGAIAIEYDSKSVKGQNIRKNLQHGFRKIIQICKHEEQVESFKKQVEGLNLDAEERKRITVIDFKNFLTDDNISKLIRLEDSS